MLKLLITQVVHVLHVRLAELYTVYTMYAHIIHGIPLNRSANLTSLTSD